MIGDKPSTGAASIADYSSTSRRDRRSLPSDISTRPPNASRAASPQDVTLASVMMGLSADQDIAASRLFESRNMASTATSTGEPNAMGSFMGEQPWTSLPPCASTSQVLQAIGRNVPGTIPDLPVSLGRQQGFGTGRTGTDQEDTGGISPPIATPRPGRGGTRRLLLSVLEESLRLMEDDGFEVLAAPAMMMCSTRQLQPKGGLDRNHPPQ
mmetsp:Transcript_33717/g.77803  ORF Transcript_33717/g.77803 Transcript_33717/m.77803 type:complete len:211 (-) Transcript_33717:210-842(-)